MQELKGLQIDFTKAAATSLRVKKLGITHELNESAEIDRFMKE